jgi:peptidyl-prolyl cis-trans isomerase B (cyclophilin B)
MKKIIILSFVLFILSGCSVVKVDDNFQSKNMIKEKNEKNSYLVINENVKLKDLVSVYDGAIMKTNYGDIKIKFYAKESPLTVNNFLNLAQSGFYDGTRFHRAIKDFMIQGGDPLSRDDDWLRHGTGGPGYKFRDEINNHKLLRGSLAMANSGPNTNGSQFFIVTFEATTWLDGMHTNFGYVIDGMDVVDKIEAVATNENDHPVEDVVIKNIELVKIGE